MSTWTSVSTLNVTIESGQQQCEIYANGLHRIGVVVSIQPTDDKGNPVKVDSATLRNNTMLIDYVTESPLNWKGDSGWCYTDTPNEFHVIPAGGQPAGLYFMDDEGPPQVAFYVCCSAGASPKSIGVQVTPTDGSVIKSSENGKFHSKVEVSPRVSFTYKQADIRWDHERAQAPPSRVYNYYLSCAKSGFYFTKFSVSEYCTDSGYEGSIGWIITNDSKDFYGAYVWYQEPHVKATKTIINFPGDRSNVVTVYDKSNNSQILGFTWAFKRRDSGIWRIPPNGPITSRRHYYKTRLFAYDQYGNSGQFWVDAKNINPNSPGRNLLPSEPKLNIYDYNPNP